MDSASQVKALFRRADEEGSGLISRTELARILQALDHDLFTDEALDTIFRKCGKIGDQSIKYEDFVDWAIPGKPETVREKAACAPRPHWLSFSGKGNGNVPPTHWAMTAKQWHTFVACCRVDPKYRELKSKAGKVTLYDLNKHFVLPWTRRTGNGVALLMNPDEPVEAKLMMSHAWGEDVEECAVAFHRFCREKKVADSVGCWFCLFANYQAGGEPGDCGPTIQEQLAKDPFGSVIKSTGVRGGEYEILLGTNHGHGMVCIMTSTAEIYDRLWCVLEIVEAREMDDVLTVRTAFSWVYAARSVDALRSSEISFPRLARIMGDVDNEFAEDQRALQELLGVETEKAKCGSVEDEAMIKDRMKLHGGEAAFSHFDSMVFKYRKNEFENMLAGSAVVALNAGDLLERPNFDEDVAAFDEEIFKVFLDEGEFREVPDRLDTLGEETQRAFQKSVQELITAAAAACRCMPEEEDFEEMCYGAGDARLYKAMIAALLKQSLFGRTCLNIYQASCLAEAEGAAAGAEAGARATAIFADLEGLNVFQTSLLAELV